MMDSKETILIRAVRQAAHTLRSAATDYDPLLHLIGDARFVPLGEASHGTHDFYDQRAQITKRLIEEQAFTAVAVEADWPDAYRVNATCGARPMPFLETSAFGLVFPLEPALECFNRGRERR